MVHQSVPKIVETTNDRARMPLGAAGVVFRPIEDNALSTIQSCTRPGRHEHISSNSFSAATWPCAGISTDSDFGSERDWIMEKQI